MPPRLSHKKTRAGCQRCKARKVKCDEGQPTCGACLRHGVSCEYAGGVSPSTAHQALPTPPRDPATSPASRGPSDDASNTALELHLMHEWDVYACKAFTTTFEYWQCQVPDTALEFRYVLDCVLAVAAFHASRRPPSIWVPTAGRMIPISDLKAGNRDLTRVIPNNWELDDQQFESYCSVLAEKAARDTRPGAYDKQTMLNVSHDYFDRAVEGHRRALNELTFENFEGAWIATILISFLTLCNLGDRATQTFPSLWLQLGSASRKIAQQWQRTVGAGWLAFSGVYYGKPKMIDEADLFNPEHARPFGHLLTHGRDYENLPEEDAQVYQESLSYIGLIHKGIVQGLDTPEITCRRLIAMPSRLHPRFTELAAQGQPRAMAMLAHAFACMKLMDGRSVWFTGIAEVQIPRIQRQLPPAWTATINWPLAIAEGRLIEPVSTT